MAFGSEKVAARFGWFAADSACGSAQMLDWLVNHRGFEPPTPLINKAQPEGGPPSRSVFT